jgi:hypothetical protein
MGTGQKKPIKSRIISLSSEIDSDISSPQDSTITGLTLRPL